MGNCLRCPIVNQLERIEQERIRNALKYRIIYQKYPTTWRENATIKPPEKEAKS
jgi:hypothetical protein